ncbi:uncharacterized protein K452DRAFT_116931 [Aplosporella prunicola CBS 121167]|uniref:Uncharacterized protein n=1 Tax=Aplosporella prunicola CBS 121167 TaxID=1176127 RepID=A0A6A6B2F1_9PEZI|nr:uncharacterized protein K452DRAFT_116931 [Aplosporella prunicola CBS 121167]KAF2136911.1 hypothetical protein K452DRAFT_116931 [Aplosporella prunicola CBS 121167]
MLLLLLRLFIQPLQPSLLSFCLLFVLYSLISSFQSRLYLFPHNSRVVLHRRGKKRAFVPVGIPSTAAPPAFIYMQASKQASKPQPGSSIRSFVRACVRARAPCSITATRGKTSRPEARSSRTRIERSHSGTSVKRRQSSWQTTRGLRRTTREGSDGRRGTGCRGPTRQPAAEFGIGGAGGGGGRDR